MKKLIIVLVAIFLAHVNKGMCDDGRRGPDISVKGHDLEIKTPAGRDQVISFDHDISYFDVILENLTFGRYIDIKVMDSEGSSQKFYKVYLYNHVDGIYIYSKELSDIPCLQADHKRKELVGACFHESACENWTERYKITKLGKLSLVERAGTYCDPTGQAYAYTDKFKNGKRISSTIKPTQ
ncbi:XAC2610-related protein [Paraburkholderia adhaesiva]|uniref:XAC2610-related protein n=1 Tax=Paraburkholderia adhaesiva TaxID=2883244 RepID=UPI001F31AAF6|nr:hypothetical protein [Paraburkholderia adhaesiva]